MCRSSRFQPGEGPSRGLLRDYEPSDLLRMELFEALVNTHAPAASTGPHLNSRDTQAGCLISAILYYLL